MSDTAKSRIDIIDALRGLSIILMIAYHALYDLTEFLGLPEWMFDNPVFNPLERVFAGLFILLAGVSSRLSRSNWRRGGMCALSAAAVTFATELVDEPVRFGILHLLSACMLIFALAEELFVKKLDDRKPRVIIGVVLLAAVAASAITLSLLQKKYSGQTLRLGWLLGFGNEGFETKDYFPMLPWLFVFMLGAWLGKPVRQGKLPKWFYSKRIKLFPAVGRHSLLLYLIHQPIMYGLVMLALSIKPA